VVEGGRCLGLAPEARLEDGVAREVDAQHLDRDDPVEAGVEPQVHLGHPAPPDEGTHFVASA